MTPEGGFSGELKVNQPALFVALSFLLLGVGYAFPVMLFPAAHSWNGTTAPEILNLYCLTAWMGMAHFLYAYQGQVQSLRNQHKQFALYAGLFVTGGLVLYCLRKLLGIQIFSILVWIYFIPHMIKAELFFSKTAKISIGWVTYWFPALCFAYFTMALYGMEFFPVPRWLLLLSAAGCVGAGFGGGVFRQFYNKDLLPYAVLSFFFIGEGLVWGSYGQYMTPQFRQGVYVFHIAMASFYHYFRSYGFAVSRRNPNRNACLAIIILINAVVIFSGYVALRQPDMFLTSTVLDVKVFTFWVGLHLWASDCFGWIRSGFKRMKEKLGQ